MSQKSPKYIITKFSLELPNTIAFIQHESKLDLHETDIKSAEIYNNLKSVTNAMLQYQESDTNAALDEICFGILNISNLDDSEVDMSNMIL